jgi:LDH2 family malate/lactate/ureidoglycolate dehydrogenase
VTGARSLHSALELLVAALTETELGERVRGTLDITDPVTKGDVLIAFDPAGARIAPFTGRLGEYLRALRATPPAPGFAGVAIPGDRSRAERARRLAEGIPLPAPLLRELTQLRDGLTEGVSAGA